MTVHADSGGRLIAAAFMLTIAVALSLVQRISTTLVCLALTAVALLAALVCVGPAAISERLAANRRAFGLALAVLGYLIVAYRLSIRPDSSFSASWVLAAAPLAFIAGSALMQNATASRVLAISISALVIALAAISCARFVLLGERAHQPLADPNNYAALMYVVWIPLAHRYLTQGWRGERTAFVRHAWVLASSFVMILAIVATSS